MTTLSLPIAADTGKRPAPDFYVIGADAIVAAAKPDDRPPLPAACALVIETHAPEVASAVRKLARAGWSFANVVSRFKASPTGEDDLDDGFFAGLGYLYECERFGRVIEGVL